MLQIEDVWHPLNGTCLDIWGQSSSVVQHYSARVNIEEEAIGRCIKLPLYWMPQKYMAHDIHQHPL